MKDDVPLIAGVGAVLLVLVIAFVMIAAPPARGHSFYDPYCCSGQDCEPIDDKRVKLVEGGYLLDDAHFIAEKDARQAPDGNYHACFWPNPETLRCFYRPSLGS